MPCWHINTSARRRLMACSVFASFWQKHWYVIHTTKKKKSRLEDHRDWQKMLSTEFPATQRQEIFRDRGCGCWQFPPPKYMCRLQKKDSYMLYMLHGCLSLCWLLFTSFHGSSIESFQSRLICVCGIFHVVTGSRLNITSSNFNSFSLTYIYSPFIQAKKYYSAMYIKLKEGDVKAFLSGRKGRLISACRAGKDPVVHVRTTICTLPPLLPGTTTDKSYSMLVP